MIIPMIKYSEIVYMIMCYMITLLTGAITSDVYSLFYVTFRLIKNIRQDLFAFAGARLKQQ